MWEEGVVKFEVLYKPFVGERKEHHEDHVTIYGFRTKICARDLRKSMQECET
jgi:hypothetical protein